MFVKGTAGKCAKFRGAERKVDQYIIFGFSHTIKIAGLHAFKNIEREPPLFCKIDPEAVIGCTDDFPCRFSLTYIFCRHEILNLKIGFGVVTKNNDLAKIMDHGANRNFFKIFDVVVWKGN